MKTLDEAMDLVVAKASDQALKTMLDTAARNRSLAIEVAENPKVHLMLSTFAEEIINAEDLQSITQPLLTLLINGVVVGMAMEKQEGGALFNV